MRDYIRNKFFRALNVSFSKSGDDIQLMKLINSTVPGVYVDIGAWHPKIASNTFFFYLRGWKGICIDPNPELGKLYSKFRPKDIFINCAVGSKEGTVPYFILEDNYSSMNTLNREFISTHGLNDKIINEIQVPTRTLENILDSSMNDGDRLDFFDVDVEGYDLEVLKSNNWEKYRPKIIVVETDDPFSVASDTLIVRYLNSKDYRLVAKTVISNNLGNLFLIAE